MTIKLGFGSVRGQLDATPLVGTNIRNHQIIIGGNGIKKITFIGISYIPTTGLPTAPAGGAGRVLLAIGKLADPNAFLDPVYFLPPIDGLSEVKFDHGLFGYGAVGFDFSNQPIVIQDNETISIIATPMYRAGDAAGLPGATIVALNVNGRSEFAETDIREPEGYSLR